MEIPTRSRPLLGGLLLAALVALAGCRDFEAEAGQSTGDLIGREFVATSITADREPRELEPGTELSLSFEREEGRDTIAWVAGCNHAGAPAEITESQLVIEGKRIATTLMGCARPLMAQDAWLWEFFEADPEWSLTRDALTLTSGETTLVLHAPPVSG